MTIDIIKLERRIAQIEKRKAKAFEERISQEIGASYGKRGFTLFLEGKYPSGPVIESILDRYRGEEWYIDLVVDKRDGNYYRFSPKNLAERCYER